MPIIGVDLAKVEKYFPDEAEKDKPEATAFDLKAIDSFVMARIQDKLTEFSPGDGNASAKINMNEAAIEACRFGIVGWSNFKNARGDDIEFKTVEKNIFGLKYTMLSDECLRQIPLKHIVGMYRKLRDMNSTSLLEMGN